MRMCGKSWENVLKLRNIKKVCWKLRKCAESWESMKNS